VKVINEDTLDALRSFVVEAHAVGYAGIDRARIEPTDDGVTVIRHERASWGFADRFVGGDPFSGLEVVCYQGRPAFAMAYYGATAEPADPGVVFGFLREALKAADLRSPMRGPRRFQRGPWTYRMRLIGSLSRFTGSEFITLDGAEVYRGWFAGGLVDRRGAL
jgi:hypothetical protein